MSSSSLSKLSSNGVHALLDGVNTYNGGLPSAIAAGAEEALGFMVDTNALPYLGKGAPERYDIALGVYILPFQIFQESVSNIIAQISKFEKLDIGKPRYLQGIRIGTLSVTTANCAAFGVKAGRKVKVHVVAVDSSLDLGGTHDYAHYATLVQEIVSAVNSPANLNKGTKKILRFLSG